MTAAHDLDARFSSLFGAGRSTGASHTIDLGMVSDRGAYNATIGILAATPRLVDTPEGQQARKELITFAYGRWTATTRHRIAAEFIRRLDLVSQSDSPFANGHYADRLITRCVDALIAGEEVRPTYPIDHTLGRVTLTVVDALAKEMTRERADGEATSLEALLPNKNIGQLVAPLTDGERARRETDGHGDCLLGTGKWRAAFSDALAAANIVEAERVIVADLDGARP